MKTNHYKLLQLSTLSVLTLLAFTTPAIAEKIYHWKDEAGKTHYTNNPALVPLDSNDTHIIKMKALPIPEPKKAPLNGKQLWQNLCAHCHNLTPQGKDGLRGLPLLIPSIKNPNTTPEKDMQILQAALDDNMDDLAEISITKAEMQAIIQYITKEATLTIPVILDAPRSIK